MDTNNNSFLWGEKQLKEISSKTLDPVATEVWEILLIYNDELSEQEKADLKNYLEDWEFVSEEPSENLLKLKDIVDTWSDSIKEYCLVKLNTQDELFKDLTEEEAA